MAAGCVRLRGTGVDLFVRLTPKSSRDAVDGIAEGADGDIHVAARVRALPEDGLANRALVRLIAEWAGVPKSAVSVTAGATARLKTLHIEGDPAVLSAAIEKQLASASR